MAKFTFRQKAIDDLSAIWNYTEMAWSEEQADKYYGIITVACIEIANGNVKGKSFSAISDGLLGYLVGKHIIFYQRDGAKEIEIIRILHEKMDLMKHLIGK